VRWTGRLPLAHGAKPKRRHRPLDGGMLSVFHPVEGRSAELIDALRAIIPAVHDEEGCRLYAIGKGPALLLPPSSGYPVPG
jgi:hypothetical protein